MTSSGSSPSSSPQPQHPHDNGTGEGPQAHPKPSFLRVISSRRKSRSVVGGRPGQVKRRVLQRKWGIVQQQPQQQGQGSNGSGGVNVTGIKWERKKREQEGQNQQQQQHRRQSGGLAANTKRNTVQSSVTETIKSKSTSDTKGERKSSGRKSWITVGETGSRGNRQRGTGSMSASASRSGGGDSGKAGEAPTDVLNTLLDRTTLRDSSPRLVEVQNYSEEEIDTVSSEHNSPSDRYRSERSSLNPSSNIPKTIFTQPPLLKDLLNTRTSLEQDAVANACLNIHSDRYNPLPHLNREAHVDFLECFLGLDCEGEQLPKTFVSIDASRPWMLYWCLSGLHSLGSDLAPYRERLIETLRPIQNYDTGGFGGGNGQKSHIAVTYAATLSLCLVGGREAFELIDRVAMWKWLSGLKQLDGGFLVCEGGEEDVRGAYCALTVLALLGLPTELAPEDIKRLKRDSELVKSGRKVGGWGHNPDNIPTSLLDGMPEYLSRCQTYEGGMAGAPGGMEAHGGYAFCSLAALCLLGDPATMLNKYLNLPRLIHWLSARQYAPEGGFSGRTNKLVDGCYSTWIGGCWALVEAALNGPQEVNEAEEGDGVGRRSVIPEGRGLVGSLWSRDGLAKYVLGCCQDERGGLRDKPGKSPDQYHSCYILLGLSSAQNYQYYIAADPSPPPSPPQSTLPFTPSPPPPTTTSSTPSLPPPFLNPRAAFNWRTSHYIPAPTPPNPTSKQYTYVVEKALSTYNHEGGDWTDYLDIPEDDGVGEELGDVGEWWYGDRVRRSHPVFNVPYQRVREWEGYVWGEEGGTGGAGTGGRG